MDQITVISVILILILLYYIYNVKGTESFGYPKWMIFYPPYDRVTRAGVKYYDRPYSYNLRRQLNAPILPPEVAAGAVGAIPIVQPPPPSQEQVDMYPAGSGSVSVPDLSNEPVAVKTAEANTGKDIISKVNGGNDEVESYL